MRRAVVIGSGGGIGAALVRRLSDRGGFDEVHALSRRAPGVGASGPVRHGRIDVADAASIAAAAAEVGCPLDLVIVATGLLYEAIAAPNGRWRSSTPTGSRDCSRST